MKTFNARHTVSFDGNFVNDKVKETEVAKKKRILHTTESEFCYKYCKHPDTPCKGVCKEFKEWDKQRKEINKLPIDNPLLAEFLALPTYDKPPLIKIIKQLTNEELHQLLLMLPDKKALSKKCYIEKELKKRNG